MAGFGELISTSMISSLQETIEALLRNKLLFLLIAVVLIIFFTARFNVNAFIVLITISFLYGLAIGPPLPEVGSKIRNAD